MYRMSRGEASVTSEHERKIHASICLVNSLKLLLYCLKLGHMPTLTSSNAMASGLFPNNNVPLPALNCHHPKPEPFVYTLPRPTPFLPIISLLVRVTSKLVAACLQCPSRARSVFSGRNLATAYHANNRASNTLLSCSSKLLVRETRDIIVSC